MSCRQTRLSRNVLPSRTTRCIQERRQQGFAFGKPCKPATEAKARGAHMSVKRFMAAQLRQPSGWFGSLVVSRLMNRANRKIIDSTLELLQVSPQNQVLEIGFGGGAAISLLTKRLSTGVVSGVDISADLVRQAERRFQREIAEGRVRVQLGDISHLPFANGIFDRVFTINTIYFWPNTLQGFAEIRRVLKNDGLAIVSLRSKETMQDYAVTKYDFRLFLPDEAADLMRQAGFRDVRVEQRHQGKMFNEVLVVGVR